MPTLTDEVNTWFDKRFILSGHIVSEKEIDIVPGDADNFGFHFSRELITFDGSLKYCAQNDGSYKIHFNDWNELDTQSREVVEALRKRIRMQHVFRQSSF